jgi:signal transduction histidine kinase
MLLSIDLDTIFNNLISNSIYSIKSSRKTEDRKVIIEGNISDDLIIINFIDHGKGLDPKYKDDPDMIFNAFESTRSDKNGNIIGTGLGLYIVKTTLSEYKDSSISYDRDISNGFGMRIALKNEH